MTGTMAVTTVLFCALARQRWRWPVWRVGAVAVVLLGWVPLAIAAGAFLLMSTWHRGTELLNRQLVELGLPLDEFLAEVERLGPPRVAGTGVFLTAHPERVPLVLQRHLTYDRGGRHHVLPGPHAPHTDGSGADDAMAQAPVRPHGAPCQLGARLLQYPPDCVVELGAHREF